MELTGDNVPFIYSIDSSGKSNSYLRIKSVLSNWMQLTVEQTIPNKLVTKRNIVNEHDYKRFAFLINDHIDKDILKYGVFGFPFQVEIPPDNFSRKVVLCFYSYSDNEPLENIHRYPEFTFEGHIGCQLNKVYSDENKKRDLERFYSYIGLIK